MQGPGWNPLLFAHPSTLNNREPKGCVDPTLGVCDVVSSQWPDVLIFLQRPATSKKIPTKLQKYQDFNNLNTKKLLAFIKFYVLVCWVIFNSLVDHFGILFLELNIAAAVDGWANIKEFHSGPLHGWLVCMAFCLSVLLSRQTMWSLSMGMGMPSIYLGLDSAPLNCSLWVSHMLVRWWALYQH